MNSDEVNWLLQTIEDPENCKALRAGSVPARKNPISRDGEFSSGPELDGLACRRKTGCVDFNGVHYDTARERLVRAMRHLTWHGCRVNPCRGEGLGWRSAFLKEAGGRAREKDPGGAPLKVERQM